jgi:hypothetical protein
MGQPCVANSHPFDFTDWEDGALVGMHNGFLHNWDRTNYISDSEWAIGEISLKGESALSEFSGSFALVWYRMHNNRVYFANNGGRTLFGAKLKCGKLVYCSEQSMLWFALDRAKLDVVEMFEFEPNYVYEFNAQNANLVEKRAFIPKKETAPVVYSSYPRTPAVTQPEPTVPATTTGYTLARKKDGDKAPSKFTSEWNYNAAFTDSQYGYNNRYCRLYRSNLYPNTFTDLEALGLKIGDQEQYAEIVGVSMPPSGQMYKFHLEICLDDGTIVPARMEVVNDTLANYLAEKYFNGELVDVEVGGLTHIYSAGKKVASIDVIIGNVSWKTLCSTYKWPLLAPPTSSARGAGAALAVGEAAD